ncbi:hypothetical protein TNCV_875721 [Trichonephila clavipes]|nr:hypothetical protein TNCV_875721 [Trichonephila clavipes]
MNKSQQIICLNFRQILRIAIKRLNSSRLGGVVGLSLAFYTQGYGFDPGPSRWTFMMQKIDSGHVLYAVQKIGIFRFARVSDSNINVVLQICPRAIDDGSRISEPKSSGEDETRDSTTPLPNFLTPPTRRCLSLDRFNVQRQHLLD